MLHHRSILILVTLWLIGFSTVAQTSYVRYQYQNQIKYGVLRGETIAELDGGLFDSPQETGQTLSLSQVKLLPPVNPPKVLAAGLNYKSHLGSRPVPESLGLFSKFPTSLVAHGDPIIIPEGSTNLHYEGELVIVMGKSGSKISVEEADKYIFGVTAGNDISERDWQRADLQWFRAKGSDTFGPIGPAIVTGLDYNDLLLETRLNGETVQSESTKDLLYPVEQIVSIISQYVTLEVGDIIFTGTPGSTSAMKDGDVVEVEIEGIGVLRNPVRE